MHFKILINHTAVRRFKGRGLYDELLDDLTVGKVLFVGLSPYNSLELPTPVVEDLLFLNKLNLSCFFCNSSICALKKKTI